MMAPATTALSPSKSRPERPATPDVTVNPYDYNMNSTADMGILGMAA